MSTNSVAQRRREVERYLHREKELKIPLWGEAKLRQTNRLQNPCPRQACCDHPSWSARGRFIGGRQLGTMGMDLFGAQSNAAVPNLGKYSLQIERSARNISERRHKLLNLCDVLHAVAHHERKRDPKGRNLGFSLWRRFFWYFSFAGERKVQRKQLTDKPQFIARPNNYVTFTSPRRRWWG